MFICGLTGLAGCFTVTVADMLAAFMRGNKTMIAHTISDLAAGRQAWIMDGGLIILATSTLVLAYGLHRWRIDGTRWRAGTILLGVFALSIIVMALVNEYGDRDAEGSLVHYKLVYLLGVVFTLIPAVMARGWRSLHGWLGPASWAIAALWLLMGPFLFILPTSFDGLYERALAALLLIWLTGASSLLAHAGWYGPASDR